MTSPMIEAVDLRKRFGATEVLRGLAMRSEQGEIFALLGPTARARPPPSAS